MKIYSGRGNTYLEEILALGLGLGCTRRLGKLADGYRCCSWDSGRCGRTCSTSGGGGGLSTVARLGVGELFQVRGDALYKSRKNKSIDALYRNKFKHPR